MAEELREQVAKQIEEAFAKTPRLNAAKVSIGSMWSSDTIDKAYLGMKWQELPDEILREHSDNLPTFVPRAFRFFVPAFMRKVILIPEWIEPSGSTLIYALAPPDSQHAFVKDKFLNKTEAFTQGESTAIVAFLEAFQTLYIDAGDKHLIHVQTAIESGILFWTMKSNGEAIVL